MNENDEEKLIFYFFKFRKYINKLTKELRNSKIKTDLIISNKLDNIIKELEEMLEID